MRSFRPAALALALALLTGCGAPAPEPTPTPSPTAETAEAVSTVFTLPRTSASLHPILSTDKVNVALSGLLWEGLFALDQTFAPQLQLCQSYTVSQDGLTWTFYLRSGVTFSDGSPLTAADVAASLELSRDPQSRFAGRLSGVSGISAQEGAVVLTLSTPNGALPALLDIPIVKAGADGVPPGTGPYRLTETEAGAVLTARTDWWQHLSLPADTIPLVTIQAADDLISAFDTEEISLVTADLTGASALGFAGDHAVWDYPTTTMVFVGYNCQKGPCADAALRRALDRAWDRTTVSVALYSRHAQEATLPLSPVHADYDQTLAQRRDYSPQVFAQLLEEAGYAQGEDGLWYRGRQALSLTFVVNTDNTFRVSAAEYLAGELTIGRDRRQFIELDKDNAVLTGYDTAARQYPVMDGRIDHARSFRDAHGTLTEEQVKTETARCLSCGASVVDPNKCIGCGICTTKCEFDAITLSRDLPQCSTMVRSEDKFKAILPYMLKREMKIRFGKKEK